MQLRAIALALLCVASSACTTLSNGRLWGENTTFNPGWERVRESAINAGRDPWVWAPLAGAALFQVEDWDRRTADWARAHTPVFGSENRAEEWSDRLRNASAIVHYATIAATPGGEDPREWFMNKARGTLVSVAAVSSTVLLTRTMKTTIDRERPNGLGGESFPSGHTSTSAVHTRLASRNLQSIAMRDGLRTGFNVGLHALTIGTSWSRIEAGWHYPADTLFSMALGNFIAAFVNDAFMGLDDDDTVQVTLAPSHDGGVLQWYWTF